MGVNDGRVEFHLSNSMSLEAKFSLTHEKWLKTFQKLFLLVMVRGTHCVGSNII